MIQRKRPARATLVGWQGHAVRGNELGGISAHWQCPLTREGAKILGSAPSLESVMLSASMHESALLETGYSDEQQADDRASASFRQSRMTLEVWGFVEP